MKLVQVTQSESIDIQTVTSLPSLLLSNYIGSLIFNRRSDRIKATARSQCTLSYTMDIIDSHTALTIVKSSTLMI